MKETTLVAEPVIDDKFWIVEHEGNKIATIQTTTHGVAFVYNDSREQFPSLKLLCNKYDISIKRKAAAKVSNKLLVNDFPCDATPFNGVYDVNKKLPIYTKEDGSKSFYCAGHYLIKTHSIWIPTFCPKLITLNRSEFRGPFKSKADMNAAHKQLRGQTK